MSPANCHADHIVPVSAGGENAMENVQLVVGVANIAKGTMDNDEFIQLCCDVARHAGGLR